MGRMKIFVNMSKMKKLTKTRARADFEYNRNTVTAISIRAIPMSMETVSTLDCGALCRMPSSVARLSLSRGSAFNLRKISTRLKIPFRMVTNLHRLQPVERKRCLVCQQ